MTHDRSGPRVADVLAYQSGFGNEFATESVAGALPVGRNSPQKAPHGLYAEVLSGTAFTAPRAENSRTWLYKMRPSAMHGPFRRIDNGLVRDKGNVLAITKRLKWHGYEVELLEHHPGAVFPNKVDMILGGGGQDSGQDKIRGDLLKIGNELHKLADSDVPMLMICGLYQLFGRFFQTIEGDRIDGISIFKAETVAGKKRLIGNIQTESDLLGKIVGFENHSGLTFLDKNQNPLAKVVKGAGNNGKDKTEGAIYRNVVGSYLHGSLLPKNPILADWLIEQAVIRKFGSFDSKIIDDEYAHLARKIAQARGR